MRQHHHCGYHSRMTPSPPPSAPQQPTQGPADLPLGDLLFAVSRRLRHRFVHSLAPTGLSPHHARALRLVDRDGPMRLGELAAALHVVPRSVTDVVDALADAGLVAREPDPTDRRATVIRTTPEGHQRAMQVEELRQRDAEDLFGRLSASDRAELERLLHQLVHTD